MSKSNVKVRKVMHEYKEGTLHSGSRRKVMRVYVAGHTGLAGSAIVRALETAGYGPVSALPHSKLDLKDSSAVGAVLGMIRPDVVILAAAMVGGIGWNESHPASMIQNNLSIQTSVINGAYQSGVQRLIFLGSSCAYPKYSPQPITEDALLTGGLESTNEAYAAAKIAGVVMCRSYNRQYGTEFISLMPTNLYGPGDTYEEGRSHVLPALIRRFHDAKVGGHPQIVLWGTGAPLREFMSSDDLATACVTVMEQPMTHDLINVGSGEEVSVRDLAGMVASVVGYSGEIMFDVTKPDGTPRKLLDSSRIRSMGWAPGVRLMDGIRRAYEDYLRRYGNA